MCDLSYLAEGEAGDGATSLMQSHSFTVTISGDVTFGQNHTAICEACRQENSFKTKSETTQRQNRETVEHFLASYQWPWSSDSRVHQDKTLLWVCCQELQEISLCREESRCLFCQGSRPLPVSVWDFFFFFSGQLKSQSCDFGYSTDLNTYQRIYSMLILPHWNQDAVLLQLVEVCYPQLVGLKWSQLQGTGQKPDLSIHM